MSTAYKTTGKLGLNSTLARAGMNSLRGSKKIKKTSMKNIRKNKAR
jgi:hypothetical protein